MDQHHRHQATWDVNDPRQAGMDQPTWEELLNDETVENLFSDADKKFFTNNADLVSSHACKESGC